MSRPRRSLPPGGVRRKAMSMSSGAVGASHGAKSAQNTKNSATVAPNQMRGFLASRRISSARGDRLFRLLAGFDARVDDGIGQVRDEVDEKISERENEHATLNDGI